MSTPTTHDTASWQAADAAHFLHPFTDFQQLAQKGSRIITKADNLYLTDSEGHRLFDGMSGLWCVNVGYGQQSLIDAAAHQMKELPFYNSFFQTTTPPAVELAQLLAEVTPPQFQHVFTPAPAARATTPWCAWSAATGICRASPRARSSSAAGPATTARRWPAPRSAG